MKLHLTSLLMTSLVLFSTSTFAALTVVGDLGGESTNSYFDAINANAGEFTPPETLAPSAPPSAVSIASALPVRTPELTPGQVSSRALNLSGMPPIFIVGDDDMSRKWLTLRAADLKRLGATGFVVNVSDKSGLVSLNSLVPGIEMAPASGSDLARRLQFSHYPLLITEKGMVQ